MNFVTFIVVQQSSQQNFIAFPSQTLSASPTPQPVSFGNHKFFKVCESVFVLQRSLLSHFFFLDSSVSDSIWCWCLIVWLTSLSMIISRSIHVAANAIISFLFMAEYYSIVYIYHIFLIHSSVDGHLGCFHVLTSANSATMNIGVHVSFRVMVFSG